MPELRRNPITKDWVIIALERSKRPNDFSTPGEKKQGGFCPFCYGNEDKTPAEVLAVRPPDSKPNTPGWSIRIVPNKFPAVAEEGEINYHHHGFVESMNAIGIHDVVIEAHAHDSHLGEHPLEHIEKLIDAIVARYQNLRGNSKLKYIQVFKNSGGVAGASLEHTHWQIISIPIIPAVIEKELNSAQEYYHEKGVCIFCSLIEEEKKNRVRVITENESFIVFCPFAARFPYETWIVPKKHKADFSLINDEEKKDLAQSLKGIIGKLERTFNYPPYNLVLHTSPLGSECQNYYHWHIEILPRLSITAGFEWGTGCFINPTAPEVAADSLKD